MSPSDDADRPGPARSRRPAGPDGRGPTDPEGAARRRGRLGRTLAANGWERAPSGDPAPRGGRPGAAPDRRADRRPGREGARPVGPGPVERGGAGRWPVPERSVLATVLGVPPLFAVGGAAALTVLGVFLDLLRTGRLGTVFTVCYVGGCVLAVAWVRRRSLFGPMVQPPLLPAAAVPLVVLLAGSPRPDTGASERLLTIGAPLVNSFPTMAWTTAAAVALGTARLLVQRTSAQRAPAGPEPVGAEPVSAPRGPDAAPGAGRRPASPEPS
jgi:hypothetical protein